jgi:hypothetical protein
MAIMTIDGISFNVDAVKEMSRAVFIKEHLALGTKQLGLSSEKAAQWAADTYDVLMGKAKKQKEVRE